MVFPYDLFIFPHSFFWASFLFLSSSLLFQLFLSNFLLPVSSSRLSSPFNDSIFTLRSLHLYSFLFSGLSFYSSLPTFFFISSSAISFFQQIPFVSLLRIFSHFPSLFSSRFVFFPHFFISPDSIFCIASVSHVYLHLSFILFPPLTLMSSHLSLPFTW